MTISVSRLQLLVTAVLLAIIVALSIALINERQTPAGVTGASAPACSYDGNFDNDPPGCR